MSAKAKLVLGILTDQEIIDLAHLVVSKMTGNATFPTPQPSLATLTTGAQEMAGLLAQRAAILLEAQKLTLQIRAARNNLEGDLSSEAATVEARTDGLPEDEQGPAILSAGLSLAADSGTPVGPMPKVEGLTATQSDLDGGIDVTWNPVKRGLKIYAIELTDDPAGQTGWRFAKNATKSKTAITGLTSGKRYWFRVSAEGSAGPGPASDPATKVAP